MLFCADWSVALRTSLEEPVWSKYSNALQASKFRVLSPPPQRPFETNLAVWYLLQLLERKRDGLEDYAGLHHGIG